MKGSDFATLLKQVATLYEEHPDLPTPGWSEYVSLGIYDLSKEQMQSVIRAFPRVEKEYSSHTLNITHTIALEVPEGTREWDIPRIILTFGCSREQVCEKRVVGLKYVPEEYVEAYTRPAHEEEIIEWDCKPILKD